MSLKDSSAYNIQFHKGRPLLIDTLSFEPATEGKPWVAYRQYCQHFLAPLALMAHRDIRLGNLLRSYVDGIPLDLASKLLPRRTRFNFSLQAHIHAHASAQKLYADTSIKTASMEGRSLGKYGLLGIIENLENTTGKFDWDQKSSGERFPRYTPTQDSMGPRGKYWPLQSHRQRAWDSHDRI
jgi:hypothetical protein